MKIYQFSILDGDYKEVFIVAKTFKDATKEILSKYEDRKIVGSSVFEGEAIIAKNDEEHDLW
jgi:hypothetical protein